MIILGLHGGPDFVDDQWVEGPLGNHDASAVLLRDGELVAAVEEERFNRFKHTNKAPVYGIDYCLRAAGLSLRDVDVIALAQTEADFNGTLAQQYQREETWRERFGYVTGRTYVVQCLERRFGVPVHPNQLYFTHHHIGHAASAYYPSSFDEALVVTLDGYGGALSGLVAIGVGSRLEPIAVIPGSPMHGPAQLMAERRYLSDSLGLFYLAVTQFLGFRLYDEYKVMGLAPYGNPATFRDAFRATYSLLPEGRYRIHWQALAAIQAALPPPPGDRAFAPAHQDAAAALQEALTAIVFHLLAHWRRQTGLDRLCLAGGVGLNCTLNGAILRSGLWNGVFVQPASHDGGLALGAALDAHHTLRADAPRVRLRHVYLGPDCGSAEEIREALDGWEDLVTVDAVEDVCTPVAAALADGAIVGWVQGRSEFGPRALGNRSILADPRPRAHIARINEMVKKREAFRPFAPAVLEEHADEYFEIPHAGEPLDYMLAAVQVRAAQASVLGATTHVDGSARVQIVRRQTNPLFWQLIRAFGDLTGVPVLLNTSFNNNHEPIVNTPADAMACFLTTDLTLLVIGSYIVRKRPQPVSALRPLRVALASSRRLRFLTVGDARSASAPPAAFSLSSTCGGSPVPISPQMFSLLAQADGVTTVDTLLRATLRDEAMTDRLLAELRHLWTCRAVTLAPALRHGPARRASTGESAIRGLLADELSSIRDAAPPHEAGTIGVARGDTP